MCKHTRREGNWRHFEYICVYTHQARIRYTSSHLPLHTVTSSELRIISSNVSRRSLCWGCSWAQGGAWQEKKTQQQQSNQTGLPHSRHTDLWWSGMLELLHAAFLFLSTGRGFNERRDRPVCTSAAHDIETQKSNAPTSCTQEVKLLVPSIIYPNKFWRNHANVHMTKVPVFLSHTFPHCQDISTFPVFVWFVMRHTQN